jgi:hypothetical protein
MERAAIRQRLMVDKVSHCHLYCFHHPFRCVDGIIQGPILEAKPYFHLEKQNAVAVTAFFLLTRAQPAVTGGVHLALLNMQYNKALKTSPTFIVFYKLLITLFLGRGSTSVPLLAVLKAISF